MRARFRITRRIQELILRWRTRPGRKQKQDSVHHAEMSVTFAIGCGRSGTHFLQRVMEEDPGIASYHIVNADADSFEQYCRWNGLSVDSGGFLKERVARVERAAEKGQIYFESNPYLGLSLRELSDEFQARFIYLVRNPEKVINSHYVKGWYADSIERQDHRLPIGLQSTMTTNRSFGRLIPYGESYERWAELTRIGKIAWTWNAVQLKILEQLSQFPPESTLRVRTEEIDYSKYRELHAFVGGTGPISESLFERIRGIRPGKGPEHRSVESWNAVERSEFLEETRPARDLLGLE